MNPEKETQQQDFPQYLCKMCGRCCKSITTEHTYEELQEMTINGSEAARVFIDLFKQYSSIEEARKHVPDQVDQVLNELGQQEGFDINKVTFYYCPYLSEDNRCGIYENRPECCKRAPNNPWSCMPPGCGFEGWQFEQREKIKKEVRKLKEYLIAAEAAAEDGIVPGKDISIDDLRKIVAQKISPWKKYGAELW